MLVSTMKQLLKQKIGIAIHDIVFTVHSRVEWISNTNNGTEEEIMRIKQKPYFIFGWIDNSSSSRGNGNWASEFGFNLTAILKMQAEAGE
jgi:hypothetical protein